MTTSPPSSLWSKILAESRALPLDKILGVLLVCALGVLGWSVPRSLTYDDLVEENLDLKARLRQLDSDLSEVERILLRLRLYDAQLQSLATPQGDHGPLTEEQMANEGLPTPHSDGAPMEPIFDDDWDAVRGETGLRPAEAWADAVQSRAASFLSLFEQTEPNLSRLVADLEELRALEAALPAEWPATGTLTSGFGWRRNPMGGGWKFHSGLDISNRRGTPIYAPAPGKVIRAYYNSGYGRMVEVDHGFGITTVYAHCTILRVKEGQLVQSGDLLGTIGTTGRSTGPHLHFEVRLDGHAVDPLDYLSR